MIEADCIDKYKTLDICLIIRHNKQVKYFSTLT